MFSFISKNWRARPLGSVETLNKVILGTESTTISNISTHVDTNEYLTGVQADKNEYKNLNIFRCVFHGEWNYLILPHNKIINNYRTFLVELSYEFVIKN